MARKANSLVFSPKRFMLLPALPFLPLFGIALSAIITLIWLPRFLLGLLLATSTAIMAMAIDHHEPFVWDNTYNKQYSALTEFFADLTAWMWPWLR